MMTCLMDNWLEGAAGDVVPCTLCSLGMGCLYWLGSSLADLHISANTLGTYWIVLG